jgi:hypothetical protein
LLFRFLQNPSAQKPPENSEPGESLLLIGEEKQWVWKEGFLLKV